MMEFRAECAHLAENGNLEELVKVLSQKHGATYEKHETPRIAAAAIMTLGREGVDRLVRFVVEDRFRAIRGMAALRVLWMAASGAPVLRSSLGLGYPEFQVDSDTRWYARQALDDFIASAPDNPDHYELLLLLQSEDTFAGKSGAVISSFASHVITVLGDSSIVLTAQLIRELEGMVARDLPEHAYQEFLAAHPVFIDPLAVEVLDRHRLGAELVTDFVVRKHDDTYTVVEIEKPQDRLFTLANDFTAQFNHAATQVLDFQGWLSENIAYAQRFLPSIEMPRGLLVMGRRSGLSDAQQGKLRRWVWNSQRIDVMTFDDLCARAWALHASLRRNTGGVEAR